MEVHTNPRTTASSVAHTTFLALPEFPEFVPLHLGHRAVVERFTKQFPPYADFTFASLYSWNIKGVVALSNLHGNLVVRFSDDITDDVFLSFLGTHQLDHTIDTLLDYAQTHHQNPVLCLIPEPVIRAMPPILRGKYTILEDRNNHDYILSVSNLSGFIGPQSRQKKARCNQFMQEFGGRVHCGPLNLQAPESRRSLDRLFARWQHSRRKDSRKTHNEFLAIRRCIHRSAQLNVQAYAVYVGDELVACELFKIVDGMAVGHFIKADASYRGVFEYYEYALARHLESLSVAYLNIQQDMGVPGLRAHKLSYGPVHFLKKYSIGRRE